MIVDLDNLKDKKLNNPEKINLEPGDLILIKSEIKLEIHGGLLNVSKI